MSSDPAYLSRFVHRDEDGWYIIWPYGRYGRAWRASYQEKHEFVRLLKRFWRAYGISFLAFLAVGRILDLHLYVSLILVALISCGLLLYYRLSIGKVLRNAQRVRRVYQPVVRTSDATWEWLIDTYSISGLTIFAIVSLFFFLASLLTVIVNLSVDKKTPQPEVVVIGLFFGGTAFWLLRGFIRSRQRKRAGI